MEKGNKILLTTLFAAIAVMLNVKSVSAATIVSIQSMPSYINNNSFKISCTSNAPTVSFSVSKHGGSTVTFATVDLTTNPCQAEVTSSQVNDQTDYTFTVTGDSVYSSTSTTYDASGPSPVGGFSKERVNDGFYKIHYRTPNDEDFDKVIIYRADSSDFSADSSHEIARVGGSRDSDMTYEDHFAPDAGKTYYYGIRALDHAGNSSSLAGDISTVTTGTQQVLGTATAKPTDKKVVVLPKESATGSVLGTEATPEASATPGTTEVQVVDTNPGAIKWVLTHKKISLGVVLVLFAVSYGIYSLVKRNK